MRYTALLMHVNNDNANELYFDQVGRDTMTIVLKVFADADKAQDTKTAAEQQRDDAIALHGDLAMPYGDIWFELVDVSDDWHGEVENFLFDADIHLLMADR
jgi:hypothetical protein